MHKYDVIAYIGRFAPCHNGHIATIKQALSLAEQVIVFIGSANQAINTRCPWPADQREDMLRLAVLDLDGFERVKYVHIMDYPYDNFTWMAQITNEMYDNVPPGSKIGIIGHEKDSTSWYLKTFPTSWEFIPAVVTEVDGVINATDIRKWWFIGQSLPNVTKMMHDKVVEYMSLCPVEQTQTIRDEYRHDIGYKERWGDGFVLTADAVVIHEDHVLVVRRGKIPGFGLLACPGGHVEKGERLVDAAIRELIEETKISVSEEVLKDNIVHQRIFDEPNRATRARVITMGVLVDLSSLKKRPTVEADDDAKEAFWVNLDDLDDLRAQFFEDHYHLINTLIEEQ